MKELDVDRLMRAYSHIKSFRDNLPEGYRVSETYVKEYHERLETLKEMGFEIDEFKIPDDKVAHQVYKSKPFLFASQIRRGAPRETVEYSKERSVERALFMIKLQAVLNYLGLYLQEPERQIGFRKQSNLKIG